MGKFRVFSNIGNKTFAQTIHCCNCKESLGVIGQGGETLKIMKDSDLIAYRSTLNAQIDALLEHKCKIPIEEPVFPLEFVKNHCPKVLEARKWRRIYRPNDAEDENEDVEYAECAFNKAGYGMKCEACDLFLTRPFKTEIEEKFLPLIEEYYEKSRNS